jgi:hypothetical protein
MMGVKELRKDVYGKREAITAASFRPHAKFQTESDQLSVVRTPVTDTLGSPPNWDQEMVLKSYIPAC